MNREFLERRLNETMESLAKTEEALRDFQAKNKTVAVEAQAKVMIEAAAMIQGQITAQEVQLQVMRGYLSPENPDLARIRSNVEELKKQLTIMGSGKNARGIALGDRLHPAMITVPDLALQYRAAISRGQGSGDSLCLAHLPARAGENYRSSRYADRPSIGCPLCRPTNEVEPRRFTSISQLWLE